MAVDAVIFDMDGVIIDTFDQFFKAYQRVLEPFHIPFTHDFFKETFGMKSDLTFKKISKDFNISLDDLPALIALKEKYFWEIFQSHVVAYPETVKLIGQLKKESIRLALATSSNRTIAFHCLDTLNLTGLFDCIVTGDQVKHSKPNPEIFIQSMANIGCSPMNTIIIEDSPAGLQAANAIGVPCFIFLSDLNDPKLFRKADKIYPMKQMKAEAVLQDILRA